MRSENLAKLAVALSGIAWGLFWIPLRGLNGAGIDAFWSFIIFNATPAIILLPLFLARWRQQRAGGPWLFAIGLSMALTQFFYSLSFLHTEIVRAMILFYFNPVWATIMARVFLGEAITPIRWLVHRRGLLRHVHHSRHRPGLSLAAQWRRLVRRRGRAWPGPSSIVLLRHHQDQKPLDLFLQNFMCTGALLLLLLAFTGVGGAPSAGLVLSQLWWLLPFIFLIAMPGVYLSMWAVPLLAPAIVGVLYMTEISAAAISSALWSGEPFGVREILGIALITVAAVLESVRDLWRAAAKTVLASLLTM